MTLEELSELFKAHDHEYGKFERVKFPLSKDRHVHAIKFLDNMFPSEGKMIANAAHDQIWLKIELDELARDCDAEDIIDLLRCGLFIDEDALSMFI